MFAKTLVGAFAYAGFYKTALLKVTLMPILLMLGLELLRGYMTSSVSFSLMDMIIVGILQTVMAFNICRVVLLGPDAVPAWGKYSLGRSEFQLIKKMFLLGICAGLGALAYSILILTFEGVTAISHTTVIVISCLVWTPVIILGSRLLLVIPAISVEHMMSFGEAWKRTKSKTAYMFGIMIVFMLITIPVSVFLPKAGVPAWLISLICYYIGIVSTIALCLAYQLIIKRDEAKESMPVSQE
ncbi:hypothetical protein [Vibrio quintilis]|uniref:Uncharacterized protein n=1 Tax=Vibrio quintilis TaxID=1117707 RepID=A0A1M7YXU9_9VIBR|nr:hypothetical protein [Vibrio quintilis]SHO57448.1 hypothetical protein VQ7734_03217 [Vibrio quintilis]